MTFDIGAFRNLQGTEGLGKEPTSKSGKLEVYGNNALMGWAAKQLKDPGPQAHRDIKAAFVAALKPYGEAFVGRMEKLIKPKTDEPLSMKDVRQVIGE